MTTIDELKALTVDQTIDARGTACPGPVLTVKQAMADLPVGAVAQILVADEGTLKDLLAWTRKLGHEHLGDYAEDGGIRLLVRKLK